MVDTTLDILRQDALVKRVKGIAGGNRIIWSAKDIAVIRERIMAMSEKTIRAAPTRTVSEFLDVDPAAVRRKFFMANAAVVKRDIQQDDYNFLFTITSPRTDLAGDSVKGGKGDRL